MLTYNIDGDLIDQRETYLKELLIITLFLALPLFGLASASNSVDIAPWFGLMGVLALSNFCRARGKVVMASLIYLLGLLGLFSLSLYKFGPNATIYTLLILPVVLSILMLNRDNVVRIAALTCALIFGISVASVGLANAVPLVAAPCFFCAVLAGVIYINAGNVHDTIYWATDIQQKDTRRAEMFFHQKEQLAETLLQLTHAKSSLELTNKKLEEATQRAEQASKAKSVFLSNMSHELRTPLNVVIGYTSTMLDMPELYQNTTLPDTYRSDVQLIKDSGYYLLGLINDILDLSKIEAGKLDLHPAAMNLPDTFKGILATAIGLVKNKPVQLRPDFDENLPSVWADSMRVRQIILNLISNAIKFTHTGSVTLQARLDGDHVRISVIDTGIGIPEKALSHIFDRFEQAERDTDKHYGGTGLGLDISRRLARMHGSELCVESEPGKGSTFWFTLPISTEQQIEENEPSPGIEHSVKTLIPADEMLVQTILLIEDEASLRDMMHRTLESVGHMVVDVQDGVQAFELATGLLPDLIILDIYLPIMNGWDLLDKLKANQETATIPVIICTVNEEEHRAIELGAASYLHKPFSPDQLLAYVENLLPRSYETDNKGTY